jgi:hypothetical protein
MKIQFSRTMAAAAAAGLLVACGGGATPEPESPGGPAAESATEGKDCCKGMNECKGQGGCAVEGKNDCKGQNECKGQGGCNAHCPT